MALDSMFEVSVQVVNDIGFILKSTCCLDNCNKLTQLCHEQLSSVGGVCVSLSLFGCTCM